MASGKPIGNEPQLLGKRHDYAVEQNQDGFRQSANDIGFSHEEVKQLQRLYPDLDAEFGSPEKVERKSDG